MVGKLELKLQWFADNNARTKYNVDFLKERNHRGKYMYKNSAMDNLQEEECDKTEGRPKKIKKALLKLGGECWESIIKGSINCG